MGLVGRTAGWAGSVVSHALVSRGSTVALAEAGRTQIVASFAATCGVVTSP